MEGDVFGFAAANAMNGFVNLEVIIGRQKGNCGVDSFIMEDVDRNLVQGTRCAGGLIS